MGAKRHQPALDGLRGIAVLLVVAFHASGVVEGAGSGVLDRLFRVVAYAGWCGVDLFFVLSGFLITGILIDAKGTPRYFRDFYVRRTLRIFPLYYVSLALLFAFWPGFDVGARLDVVAWLATYAQNVAFALDGPSALPGFSIHFWSLAVEEQFYLAWPLVVFMASRRQLAVVSAVAIGAAVAARIALVSSGNSMAAYVLMPCRMDALAWGALASLAVRHRGERIERLLDRAWVAMVLLGAIAAAAFGARRSVDSHDGFVLTAGVALLAPFFTAWLLTVTRAPEGSRFHRLHAWSALRAVGKYSYAVYVAHLPLLLLAVRSGVVAWIVALAPSRTAAQALLSALLAAASIAVALVSWHVVEKRFAALKSRFEYAPAPAAAPVSAAAPDAAAD